MMAGSIWFLYVAYCRTEKLKAEDEKLKVHGIALSSVEKLKAENEKSKAENEKLKAEKAGETAYIQ